MHLAENVDAASRVLKDPWYREFFRRAQKVSGHGVVRVAKDLCGVLLLNNDSSERLRNTAILFRDHPKVAQQLMDQFESELSSIEREQVMTNTNVAEKNVLTAADLCAGKRFSFVWNGWPCDLYGSVTDRILDIDYILDRKRIEEGYVESFLGRTSGFCIRVTFPLRRVEEFLTPLIDLVKKRENFVVCGITVHSILVPVASEAVDIPLHHFPEWFRAIQSGRHQLPPNSHGDVEVGALRITFLCDPNRITLQHATYLKNHNFRNAYMLACLKHYFGIETEEIEYEPVAEEETLKDPKSARICVTDEQMVSLIELLSGSELTIKTIELVVKMLTCTDNLSKPVILDVKVGEGGVSGVRVCQEVKGAGGYQLNRLLRLAGSEFYASARVTPEGRLKVTISSLEDEDESTFVQCKLDERV